VTAYRCRRTGAQVECREFYRRSLFMTKKNLGCYGVGTSPATRRTEIIRFFLEISPIYRPLRALRKTPENKFVCSENRNSLVQLISAWEVRQFALSRFYKA
jgi:hypothetical protein